MMASIFSSPKSSFFPKNNNFICLSALCLAMIVLPVSVSLAELITTGDVSPTDPSTWTTSTYAFIGSTDNGTLEITNGSGVQDNSGYIGYNYGSMGIANVDGTGSTWINSSCFTVGYNGIGTLNITDGGKVSNSTYGMIGYGSTSTGEVLVDGEDSTWTNSGSLKIGYYGNGTLDITNGATVSNTLSYIGGNSGSTGTVTVNGEGSTWTNSDVFVGVGGTGVLNITNGGKVISIHNSCSYIGYGSDSSGTVTVDGDGSTWENSADLNIGNLGTSILNITNGGTVSAAGTTTVNSAGMINFGTNGGTFTTKTLWSAPDQLTGTGTINAYGVVSDVDLVFGATQGERGTTILNDSSDQNITLNVDLSGTTTTGDLGIGYEGSGSMLVQDGVDIKSREGYIGYRPNSTGEITITGEGSSWTNSSYLNIGYWGTGTLNITNGAAVTSSLGGDSSIGTSSISTGTVRVDGTGSTWACNSDLYVGKSGSGTLNITNGAAVSDYRGYIGKEDSTATSIVTVDGTGSNWTNISFLYVGYSGNGTLEIMNDGTVNNTTGYIGYKTTAKGTVTVDGEGSTWINSDDLYVGSSGKGTLNITNGGAVSVADSTYVTSKGKIDFGTNGGTLTTTTLWSSSDCLTGTGTINAYGLVSDIDLVFDATRGSSHATFLNDFSEQNITLNLNLSGTTTTGHLGIGYTNSASMMVQDGVAIQTKAGYIGYNSGSSGNVAVKNEDSNWINTSNVFVGYSGSGSLNITDGATVSDSSGILGYNAGATGTATVDGLNSSWINSNSIYVGYSGSGALNITNGGSVTNTAYGYIGSESSATGVATVDGAGSSWTNSNLNVGQYGTGTLNIINEATIISAAGYIGNYPGSSGIVAIDGEGSSWTNSSSLNVGYFGTGTLDITSGATVSSTAGYMGNYSDASGIVTINGEGSTWTNSGSLYVANSGSGTLDITNGGMVSNTTGYIGYKSNSTGTVTVDGADSTWSNNGDIYVGNSGSGTLNITNGGKVIVTGTTYINSNGLIDFDNNGGTLTTGTLYYPALQMVGNGTVNTHGFIGDAHFVFDNSSGENWSVLLNESSNQNIILNLDLSGTTMVSDLGIGYTYSGSMDVRDGVNIKTLNGYIGYNSASTGEVTIEGEESSWTNTANLNIGYSGTGRLYINGAEVNNAIGYIGYNSGSIGEVAVNGSSAKWANSGNLNVGYSGNGTLEAKNGAAISNAIGYIGYQPGVSGTVTVNGTDSSWTNSDDLYVGYSGEGVLNITDGAMVSTSTGIIGYNSGSTGTVTVDGMNSSWVNNDKLYVGYSGTGTLNITDGANVSSGIGDIGLNSNSTGTVNVDGVGSSWTNSSGLYIGCYGNGTLNITNGAMVSSTMGTIGSASGSNGTVTIDGTGSIWANKDDLYIGKSGSGILNITNGGMVSVSTKVIVGSNGLIDFGTNGGTLSSTLLMASSDHMAGTGTINAYGIISDVDLIFDATHAASHSTLMNDSPDQNITLNLDLSGSIMTCDLGIGYTGDGSMRVQDGVAIKSQIGYVGYNSGSTGYVSIEGESSSWANNIDLYVGNSGSGTLNIMEGATVSNSAGYIGCQYGSSGTVAVDGESSSWTNRGNLYVGRYGTGTLDITHGAAVSNTTGNIGYGSGKTGEVTVDGGGSTWTNNDNLYIGYYGNGTLDIMHGGTVSNAIGYIGSNSASSGTVMVDGEGSNWMNSSSLYVGNYGNGVLNITNGAAVSNTTGYIGYDSGKIGAVTVNGIGSTWTNNGELYAGYYGVGTINITGGAVVSNDTSYIGYNSGSTGMMSVDGTGSTWASNGDLYVGKSGNGTLNITNGGVVSVLEKVTVGSNGLIDFGTNGGTLSSTLLMASSDHMTGTGTISAYGIISDVDLIFDATHAASHSTLMNNSPDQNITLNLDLSGSIMTCDLGIGYTGDGSMRIQDGVAIKSQIGYVGYNSGSTGDVSIEGENSSWTNNGELYVGNSGSGTLNIMEGAAVSNSAGYIGYDSGSSGTVTVDGESSSWTNSGYLYVGRSGTGTLNITNNAAVSVEGTTYVGSNGLINFGTNGGTLTTRTLVSPSRTQLMGTGTINAYGLMCDMDLVCDATSAANPSILLNDSADQNITINLDLSGTTTTGDLGIGYTGDGSMIVSDHVNIKSGNGYIGYSSGSTGIVTVNGSGSSWTNSGSLHIGHMGNGTLNINNGAIVTDATSFVGGYYYGFNSSSNGIVNVDGTGSRWRNIGYLYVGSSGTGTLNITNGAKVTNSTAYIGNSYFGQYYGSTSANGTVTVDGEDSTWTNNGNLYVGHYGTGTLTISNSGLVSIGGTLSIDSDPDGDGFVYMTDGGMLAINGDADDSIGEFLSLVTGSDAICYWDETDSAWENISLATENKNYTLDYLTDGDLAGYTLLTYLGTPIPGDANYDGVIDIGDLGILAANYGKTGDLTWAQGDYNLDGMIDVGDLGFLAANYGGISVELATFPSVPEPMTMSLLAFAGLVSILRRR